MKKYLHIFSLVIFCIMVSSVGAYAIKASTNIIKYKQPDGSVVLLKMFGDEFFGYCKTTDGYIVSKGPDGYLYHANYNSGFLSITTQRVNGCNTNTRSLNNTGVQSLGIPVGTIQSLREKAYMKLNGNTLYSDNTAKSITSLVLLVQFADIPFTINNPVNYFKNMLNQKGYSANGATGSASDYLNVSFGNGYSFMFDVHGIITLPNPVEYYGRRTETMSDANVAEMVVEACKIAAQEGVDFSRYDLNGDGTADNVAIIFAGCNEAESANSSLIWPHKGDISANNIELGGIKLASYTCSSEYSGSEAESRKATIGIFCHEYLHSFGVPDLYDVNGSNEGDARALYGKLSIMDEGYYSNGGKTPPYLTSIEREILGLDPVKDIIIGKSYTIAPIQSSDTLYRISTANDGEYFLVECRNAQSWDAYIGGSGMLVYHIDKSQNICGGLSAAKRWELNIVNSFAPHECARLLAADPFAAEDGSIGAVFYPGTNSITSLTASGMPKLTDWQHMGLGISLKDIVYEKNGHVTFKATGGIAFSEKLPEARSLEVLPYQKSLLLEWKSDGQTNIPQSHSTDDGQWHITITKKDTLLAPMEYKTKDMFCVAEFLEPETEYNGTLFYTLKDSMGKVATFSFATNGISSPYPYIKVSGKYKTGAVVCFEVQNLTEKYNSINVKVNDEPVNGSYYRFDEAKEYLVEVIIKYPDKSQDVITKKIVVE